jgi:hypothetical protein
MYAGLVELRSHPLMSYRGAANWPPVWNWRGGEYRKEARGEVGTLTEVIPSGVKPADSFFLIIEYEDCQYMGCLIFTDRAFCRQMFTLLHAYRGCTIQHIGGLDLSHLL